MGVHCFLTGFAIVHPSFDRPSSVNSQMLFTNVSHFENSPGFTDVLHLMLRSVFSIISNVYVYAMLSAVVYIVQPVVICEYCNYCHCCWRVEIMIVIDESRQSWWLLLLLFTHQIHRDFTRTVYLVYCSQTWLTSYGYEAESEILYEWQLTQ